MMLKKGRSSGVHEKECSLCMYKVILPFGVPKHYLALNSSLQEKHMDKLKNVQRRKARMIKVTENMAKEGGEEVSKRNESAVLSQSSSNV